MNQKNETIEKPSAFKNWINEALVARMGEEIKRVFPDFKQHEFCAVQNQLKPLELKARVQCVREQLKKTLPDDYLKSLKILLSSTRTGQLKGFDLWPYSDFIQNYGLNHVDESLNALKELTEIFSSEFAVRPFLIQNPKLVLGFLNQCATDKNVHIRRWVSEGTRPRLPWGQRLPVFVKNPEMTIPLLAKLKHDSELYVRKSVANHLNDIAKDHPELACKTLKHWIKESKPAQKKNIEWITRHALRTLIKQGNPEALALIGVSSKAKVSVQALVLKKLKVKVNDSLGFSFKVISQSSKPQKIVIDYIVHYKKANGMTAPKVFKLKTILLQPKQTLEIEKKHSLKVITTRVYYPGNHAIEIQVNGKAYHKKEWHLAF